MMELLSPAGNIEKLYYAWEYGADAAYIGLKKFSLRVKADNFYDDEYKNVCALKKRYPGRKLHCALNISFHDRDIDAFTADLDYFRQYPIDAFIVQDLGIVPLVRKHFPDAALHLSTQASCVNSSAVKMYRELGFSRIVLGREISLDEIRRIKDSVPEMELEAFCHGAMCIAYAGRCLMSAYLTGRSAQSGFCSHTCRWEYDVLAQSGRLFLREHQRPDEYFPVFEGDDFTAVLSSKDLCMINHLADMKAAGIDSVKIEGRMKSIYYVAVVTRAYRKALDVLDGKITDSMAAPFIAELDNVSHRESTTGFYYGRAEADLTTSGASDSRYQLAAKVGRELTQNEVEPILSEGQKNFREFRAGLDSLHPEAKKARLDSIRENPDRDVRAFEPRAGWRMYEFTALNKISAGTEIEFVSPEFTSLRALPGEWLIADPRRGTLMNWVCDGHPCVLYTKYALPGGTLVRTLDDGYRDGVIRDNGR